jgi:hypothetical protein|tara:strand:+ start:94 stop:417 length:324 start_codon:yes stop_codon:yes gene_type:complete
MAIQITRRDLLNGVVIGTGCILLPAYAGKPGVGAEVAAAFNSPDAPVYYPPGLTQPHSFIKQSGNQSDSILRLSIEKPCYSSYAQIILSIRWFKVPILVLVWRSNMG